MRPGDPVRLLVPFEHLEAGREGVLLGYFRGDDDIYVVSFDGDGVEGVPEAFLEEVVRPDAES